MDEKRTYSSQSRGSSVGYGVGAVSVTVTVVVTVAIGGGPRLCQRAHLTMTPDCWSLLARARKSSMLRNILQDVSGRCTTHHKRLSRQELLDHVPCDVSRWEWEIDQARERESTQRKSQQGGKWCDCVGHDEV